MIHGLVGGAERGRGRGWFAPTAGTDLVNSQIGTEQARRLVEAGHSRLACAYLVDERLDRYGAAREHGVRVHCQASGLAQPQILHVALDRAQAAGQLRTLPLPCGIACYDDEVAAALLTAAHDLAMRVPDEVALIGMGHTWLSRLTTPPLATFEYDLSAAVDNLVQSIAEAPEPGPVTVHTAIRFIPGGTI